MIRIIFSVTVFLFTSMAFAQNKMRPVEELINKKESAWPGIQKLITSATNKVEILPGDTASSKDALYKTQVTTRSSMGAVVYETGGILIDNGWIRILGSGCSKFNRTLPDWNKGKTFQNFGEQPVFYLIADDAVGGFFAINGGALGRELGKVYYLSPDRLEWEALDLTYGNFLQFCFTGNIKKFYADLRWTSWKKDISQLQPNQVFTFYPFLWSKEGKNISKNTRSIVPIEEQYNANTAMRKQLGLAKNGY